MTDLPRNPFKRALKEGRVQLGLWSMMPDPFIAEMLAETGYDWVLLDTEHSPSDLRLVASQLQATRGGSAHMVVRPPVNDPIIIKQFLDIGTQSLLLPMVNTAEEARAAVAATRYPPEGMRGVAGVTRASRYGKVKDYALHAAEEICVLVQAETRQALEQLEDIAAVEGVDGIFIGPADLAASLGFPGQPTHPEVMDVIEDATARIAAAGLPAGILTFDAGLIRRVTARGARFVAVGVDISLLQASAEQLAQSFSDLKT